MSNYKSLIESLDEGHRKVFNEICNDRMPLNSMGIMDSLESKGLIAWYQLDPMSGFYEVANAEIYAVWCELNPEKLEAIAS
jgi:hypothetical protein